MEGVDDGLGEMGLFLFGVELFFVLLGFCLGFLDFEVGFLFGSGVVRGFLGGVLM